jgi:hypothetical protein
MTPSRDELRKIAEAATPGPWKPEMRVSNFCRIVEVADPETCIAETGSWAPRHFDEMVANATFIAAANPAVVIELLDTIKTLREALEPFKKFADAHITAWDNLIVPDNVVIARSIVDFTSLRIRDFRRARAAIGE